ncbi:MAG: sigma-70 family RNA polymerase sigma factor [Deltaproteobacteria bacterium]|nr:sigma-70 family RNA polymerase sigma factor [Nannocystaceae bacterium]
MPAAQRPGEIFCAALPADAATAWSALAGLDAVLEQAHALATPPAPCPAPSLARHLRSLAVRVDPARPDVDDVLALDHAAIALADACVDGDTDAIAAFHRTHLGDIEHAIARARAPERLVDDIRQIVLAKLLPPGKKLARYAGRGALHNWVRAVTVRETISVLRAGDDAPLDDTPLELAATGDLELSFIRKGEREHVRAALRAAFAALEPEDRAVLRYRFVDGLTLDQLAVVLGVHRATGARWLARIREELLRGVKRRLFDQLGLRPQEFDSLVALVRSNLEITLGGLLRA